MRQVRVSLLACLLVAGVLVMQAATGDDIADRAHKLHFSSIVLDTHDDTTQRFFSKSFDIGKRNPDGHIDIPRMREGGMNAIFFSIWIDGRIMGPPAVQKAIRRETKGGLIKKIKLDALYGHEVYLVKSYYGDSTKIEISLTVTRSGRIAARKVNQGLLIF